MASGRPALPAGDPGAAAPSDAVRSGMGSIDLLRTAVAELRSRALRSTLSVGVFAASVVVAVVLIASGEGLREAVGRVLHDLGEGQVAATPGRTTGVGGVRRSGREVRIRYRELPSVRGALPSFRGVAAYYDLRGGGASSWRYSIPWSPARAVAPDYRAVRGIPLAEGRWFSDVEQEEGRWVAVLNQGLREILFRRAKAVGRWIEWRGRRMEVVGVVRDEAVFPYLFFIPYETVTRMADARYVSGLIARPRPSAEAETAIVELRRALAGLGGFDWRDENALEVESNHEFTRKVRTLTGALHALVITIALVSLFLGGSGVANMVAIGVTERTREIGLRKALGARTRDIFAQVLTEAALIIAAGAALGLGAGWAVCAAIGEVRMTARYAATVELGWAAGLGVVSALAVVGFVFAAIPARRAARLAPAEALRWE